MRLAFQKQLLIVLQLEDIMEWVLFTLSTTCFFTANLGETLSSRTLTLLFSNLPVMWCKSLGLVHSWDLDQNLLTGIETQHLFPTVLYWLTCCHKQTINYFFLQTPYPFHQCFAYRTVWNSQKFCKMDTQNLPNFQVFQTFSHKCKSLFLQSCPKEFIRLLCEYIVNPPKGSLQSIRRHHMTNFQNNIRLLFLGKWLRIEEETFWHQKNGYNAKKSLLFSS